ncbi:MAG: hypothetical protein ACR2P4_05500 [Gammaproteobacteria bacterium]
MTTIRTIIALFAIGLAFSPAAQEAGIGERFYLGVGGAQFKTRLYDICPLRVCTETNKKRTGVMFYGGYQATEYFGAELGGSIVNGFGTSAPEFRFLAGDTVVAVAPEMRVRSEYRNIYAAGTARLPVIKRRLFLTGKLGGHYYKRKDTTDIYALSGTGNPPLPPELMPGRNITTAESVRPLLGAGVELQIGKGGLRADWTKFLGDSSGDMEVIAVNYIYRF